MSKRACLLTGHPECLNNLCATGREPCARSRAPTTRPEHPLGIFRFLQSTGAIETYRVRPSFWRRLWLYLT